MFLKQVRLPKLLLVVLNLLKVHIVFKLLVLEKAKVMHLKLTKWVVCLVKEEEICTSKHKTYCGWVKSH
jgi:hypothetical protein